MDLIQSADLEDRVIQFSTEDGNYFLNVLDRESMVPIDSESIALLKDCLLQQVTHVPEQQISGLRRRARSYLLPVASLLLLFGAYNANKNPGAGGMLVLGLSAGGFVYALADHQQKKIEDEMNARLSSYGFPTITPSK